MKFKENAIKPGMVIHCPKEEDARVLLEHLDSLEYCWSNGNSLSGERSINFDIKGYYFIEFGKKVTIGIEDDAESEATEITEFSDLIEPDENLANKANDLDNQQDNEMTAVEVLEWLAKHCGSYDMIDVFGRDKYDGAYELSELIQDFSPDEIIQKITAYETAKKEKPVELEWVNVVRIIDEDTEKCVQKIKIIDGARKIPTERALKEYRTHHEGNYYAVVERRCRVKGE